MSLKGPDAASNALVSWLREIWLTIQDEKATRRLVEMHADIRRRNSEKVNVQ